MTGRPHINHHNYLLDCKRCGEKFFSSKAFNTFYCKPCRPLMRQEYDKARYKRLKAEGKCVICEHVLAAEDHVCCVECNEMMRQRATIRKAKIKREHRCNHCGKVHNHKTSRGVITALCSNCMANEMARQKLQADQRLAQGLCAKCGIKPRDGEHYRCTECKEKANTYIKGYRRQRVLDGICVRCFRPSYEGRVFCELHTIEKREYLRLKRFNKRLQFLFKQEQTKAVHKKIVRLLNKNKEKKQAYITALDTFYSKEKRNV